MLERWNIGFQKDTSHFNFIVNPAGGGTINPTLHYPRTHYSTIPLFQHSNCERSELSSNYCDLFTGMFFHHGDTEITVHRRFFRINTI